MADFGEILQHIGEFGLFQKVVLVALGLPEAFFNAASVIFIESDPERHCDTGWILSAHPNLSREEQLNLTVPREEDGTFSRCRMFVPVDWNISSIREYGLNETTGCQDGWVYYSTLYESTIVTDFDLVCDRAYLLQVAQTVLMVGTVAGSFICGPLAESFGRKRGVQISVALPFIFSATATLSPNVYMYMISLLLMGIGYGGFQLNAITLATEWIGISKRSQGACVAQLFGAVGQCIIVGLMYGTRDWRLTQLITSAIYTVIVIYIWFIPESARWLLSRGRTEEAKELICKAAKINKRSVPEFQLEPIVEKTTKKWANTVTLFKSPLLRKYFLIVTFAWFSLILSQASIVFDLANFGMDIFLTQLLFGLTEMPAHILCIWTLEALGRKISLASTLLVGGLSCIIIVAVPQGEAVAVTLLTTTGRFFMMWAGSVWTVYIRELFPTSMRQSAVGLSYFISRLSSILAPSVNGLARHHISLPPLVYGSLTFSFGVLCFLLPETRGKELPESISEDVGNGNKSAHAEKDKCEESQSTKL